MCPAACLDPRLSESLSSNFLFDTVSVLDRTALWVEICALGDEFILLASPFKSIRESSFADFVIMDVTLNYLPSCGYVNET